MARWVSANPVYTWQFEAFRSLVQIGRKRDPFPSRADYLAHTVSTSARGLVGDVYHDEALAYGWWFGKTIASSPDWQDVKETLGQDILDRVLPADRLCWDGAEYPLSEFVRMAWKQSSLYKYPTDEHDQRESDTNVDLPDRVLFEEWDRSPDIGFSTEFWACEGRLIEKSLHTMFFDLENSATFPAGFGAPERE